MSNRSSSVKVLQQCSRVVFFFVCKQDKARWLQCKASFNKDAQLIAAQSKADTTYNLVRTTANHKTLIDNQVPVRTQWRGSLTLFILFLSATALLVLVNETKRAEMHQKGYCSHWNSEISLNPIPHVCMRAACTHIQRTVSGQCVRESDRQRGLCNSREEAQDWSRETHSLHAGLW